MNPFQHHDEYADGLGDQTAPWFVGAAVLLLRDRVGVRYVSILGLVGESVLGGTLALFAIGCGRSYGINPFHWLDGTLFLLVIALTVGHGIRKLVVAKIRDLRRYSPVHRYFSGVPHLYHVPPDRWLERLLALEPRRPRTARGLVRLVLPAYRFRIWVGRQQAWFVKAIVEPGVLGGFGLTLVLASYFLGLPFWLLGGYGLFAAAVLSHDQIYRSLSLYEETREFEDAAIAGNQLADRLHRRRHGGW